jgi:hypothetical protein
LAAPKGRTHKRELLVSETPRAAEKQAMDVHVQKDRWGNQTEDESWRQKNQHQEPHIESLSSDPERAQQGKSNQHKTRSKTQFSIELKQEYNRSTDVTALPYLIIEIKI